MNQTPSPNNNSPALFIGIDWADQAHDCYITDADGNGQHQKFKQTPEAIEQWVGQMRQLADGRPIAIMLEQSKGPLIYSLMFRPDVILYPVDPKQFARYRESYPGGNSKSVRPTPGTLHACYVNVSRRCGRGSPTTKHRQ
jgi:Transposase